MPERLYKFVIFFSLITTSFFVNADFISVKVKQAVLFEGPSKTTEKIFIVTEGYPLEVLVSLKEWKKVNKLIKKLDNNILLGNVYAEKYLHPTGWRSSYKELKTWLDKYNDHPDATRISRIAIKRKPKNAKIPKAPTKGFLNGYGTYKSNSLKPRFPLNNKKYSRYSYLTSIKFRKAINKRNTQYAENLLNSKNQSHLCFRGFLQLDLLILKKLLHYIFLDLI